jgi:hypothetical protein
MPVLDAIAGSLLSQEKPYKLTRQIPVSAAEMIVETSVRLDVSECI